MNKIWQPFGAMKLSQQSINPQRLSKLICGWLAIFLLFCSCSFSQEVTPREKQSVRKIKSLIDRAARQYKADKLEACQQSIEEAMKQVEAATSNARAELLKRIEPEYARLTNAHRLLTDAGQVLPSLAVFPEPVTGEMATVSFKSQIAPILVAKCGNCHVNRTRGNFNAATFATLSDSTMIANGLPKDSRLIEVIENGEMPKGGLQVEPDELELLKRWIQLGAKFDGDNPQQKITELAAAAEPARPDRPQPAKPTGKETVSFGLHVAPILIENCGQCHINNNPRGNLNMASFRNLLSGGDSGPPIVPGRSGESLLFQRIKAGEMPPTGKLDAKLIDIVGKWIDEGATLAEDPRLEIQMVAAKAKSDSQTHDELISERTKRLNANWRLVMHDVESTTLTSQNFAVIGSATEDRLASISQLLESLVPEVSATLQVNSSQPLVKGNVSVFVFDKRYDFGEFGKMVEQRDFPKEISEHWGFNTIDAYAAILMARNQSPDDIKVSLTQQIAAIHTASLAPDVPRWFADGVGYWAAKKIHSREDAVKSWDADAWQAARSMTQPDDFIKNQMPSDQAALVGYLFVDSLRSERARFRRLLKTMQEGNSFESSFALAFGSTPAQLFGNIRQGSR